MWHRGSKICGRHVLSVDICWFVAFLFLMVLLRPQGSIHKVVPLGNGARARIDVSCTSGALSEFQEKMRGIARAEIVKEDQLKVEKEAGGEVEREDVFWIVLSVQEGSVVWKCCLVSILYSCM